MAENKLMHAYSQILHKAKQELETLEHKSWDELVKLIDKVEYEASTLGELTEEELAQVRNDLKADIQELAQYFNDVNQGIHEFLEMDIPVLEKYLEEKALSLADPTQLAILRLRLTAAMEEAKKHRKQKEKQSKQ